MKFKCSASELVAGLTRVGNAVEHRTSVPILANVLVDVTDAAVTLRGTNLDVEVQTSVPAEVESAGTITVPAKLLSELCKKYPKRADISVELVNDSAQMLVKSGRSRVHLHTLPATDFPTFDAKDSNHRFDLSSSNVKELFGNTAFSMSTEQTRYYLNGVYLHPIVANGKAARLRGVATDGHRLAQFDCALPEGAEGFTDSNGSAGVIVPSGTVVKIVKLAEETDGDLHFELNPTRITISNATTRVASKLIDGTYPNYGQVIPANNDKRLCVDRDQLKNAIDRVSTVSSERGRAVKLTIEEGKLKLSVANPEAGAAEEEVEVDYSSDPLEIGFNSAYLLDILDHIKKTDTIEIMLADAGSPTLLRGVDDESALFVQMPMRV